MIADGVTDTLNNVRYDSELALLQLSRTDMEESITPYKSMNVTALSVTGNTGEAAEFSFKDVYVHPSNGVSVHPWASWDQKRGFLVQHEADRIKRRLNLMKFPFRLSTPVRLVFISDPYSGTTL